MSTSTDAGLLDYEVFALGDFILQHGMTLRDAKIAYKTYGTLNAARNNAIVYPTWFGGQHSDNEYLIGPGMALDPDKYFIIVPDMFANGLSPSPSNVSPPYDRARFPNVTYYDNVRAQHRLVTERFGIEKVALVLGWSMAAGQTYQWAVSYPDMVERILPFCATARIPIHNFVVLEGLKAALQSDPDWRQGWYDQQPTKAKRDAGRVSAGWGLSAAFYREEVYLRIGYASLDDFLVGFWENLYRSRDINDLLAMLWTLQHGDVGATPGFSGSLEKALGSITARALVMPSQTDFYFPAEDSEREVRLMAYATFRPIPSIWGHWAGSGMNPEDTQFIDDSIKELLRS